MSEVTFGIGQPFGQGLFYPDFISGAQPAAGANYALTVPGDYWLRVLGCLFTLATDSNAANRAVSLDFINGRAVTYLRNGFGATIAASTTQQVQFQVGRGTTEVTTGTVLYVPLCDLILQSGSQVQITVGSIQVGDQLSGIQLAVEKFPTGSTGYPRGTAHAPAARSN